MPDFEFMNTIMASMDRDREMQAAQAAAIRQAKAWQTQKRLGAVLVAVAVILAFFAESL